MKFNFTLGTEQRWCHGIGKNPVRNAAPFVLELPSMTLNPAVKDIFDFQYGDFTLENYQAHAGIKAPIAV